MEENKKGNKVLVIAVVILSILVIALGGYICYDKVISKNNDEQTESNKNNNVEETNEDTNKDNNNINDNSANLDFDFNELSNTLHSSIQKEDITSFISKYVETTISANDPPEIEQINTFVSNNTIDIIINKLKTAKSIDKEITYSWFACPPKSIAYYISVNSIDPNEVHSKSVFSLNYSLL